MWHRLLNHPSKCKNLHGHRYRLEITLSWLVSTMPWSQSEWMVVDFSDIKKIAQNFIDTQLDHWYMYQDWDQIWILTQELGMKNICVQFPPTAENIVTWLFEKLQGLYWEAFWQTIILDSLKLYETPNSYVIHNRSML